MPLSGGVALVSQHFNLSLRRRENRLSKVIPPERKTGETRSRDSRGSSIRNRSPAMRDVVHEKKNIFSSPKEPGTAHEGRKVRGKTTRHRSRRGNGGNRKTSNFFRLPCRRAGHVHGDHGRHIIDITLTAEPLLHTTSTSIHYFLWYATPSINF